MRKPKSFAWLYLWFLLTSGLFSVYWLYSLMEDLNAIAGRRVFRSGLVILPLALAFAAVVGGIAYFTQFEEAFATNASYQSIYIAVCISAEAIWFMTAIWVYRGFLKIENKQFGLADVGFAVGTVLLMGVFFPYMQIRANDRLTSQGASGAPHH